jgi:hypothetical protein
MFYTWICVMATTIAINTIFIVTLLAALTWEQRAMFLFATAAVAGGLFFTIGALRILNPPHTPSAHTPPHK